MPRRLGAFARTAVLAAAIAACTTTTTAQEDREQVHGPAPTVDVTSGAEPALDSPAGPLFPAGSDRALPAGRSLRPSELLAPEDVPDELRPTLDLPSVEDATWRRIDPPPIDLTRPRWGHALHAIDDRRVVVFGGSGVLEPCNGAVHGDGAVLDVTTGEWTVMPELPMLHKDRVDAASAWTGDALLVWGGAAHGGCIPDNSQVDGASWDPDTNAWSELPPAPIAARQTAAHGWTGQELLVWGGTSAPFDDDSEGLGLGGPTYTDRADGAAYDPSTNTWRLLPTAPDELGSGPAEGVVADGGFWVFTIDAVARLDLAVEQWEVLARPDRWLHEPIVVDGRVLARRSSAGDQPDLDDPDDVVEVAADGQVTKVPAPWLDNERVQVRATTTPAALDDQLLLLGIEAQRRPLGCGTVEERYIPLEGPGGFDVPFADPGEPGVEPNPAWQDADEDRREAILAEAAVPASQELIDSDGFWLLSRCRGWPVVPLGAALDPATGRARQLPPSPWRGRPEARTVQVGDDLLLFGGRDAMQRPLDGAYAPDPDDPSRFAWLLDVDGAVNPG